MRQVNYKSDFDFIFKLTDCEGNEMPFPNYDFVAYFYTNSIKDNFEVSVIGGECKNCFNDEGQIHVVCNAHRLSAGKLKVEFHAQLPDEIYPDGRQLVVTPAPLDIELVRGAGDCPHEDMSAELRQPVMTLGTLRQVPPPAFTSPVKRRNIPIGAVPGFVYRWKRTIRLGSNIKVPLIVDLSNFYMKINSRGDDKLDIVPLKDVIESVKNYYGDDYDYNISEDGTLTASNNHDTDRHTAPVYAVVEDTRDNVPDHIAVQQDGLGRIIFTPLSGYPEYDIEIVRPVITEEWIRHFTADGKFRKFRNYDTRIWLRHGRGGYMWRGHGNGKKINAKRLQYYVCVRKKNRHGQRSEWVYLNLFRHEANGKWGFEEIKI